VVENPCLPGAWGHAQTLKPNAGSSLVFLRFFSRLTLMAFQVSTAAHTRTSDFSNESESTL
jgi:hypothetical protein